MINDGAGWATTLLTGWHPATIAIATGVVALAGVALLAAYARARRTGHPNLKLQIGTVLVQAGMTWAVVTGVMDFCLHVFGLNGAEAIAFAVFFEASVWVTVGRIVAWGRSVDEHGHRRTGFGPAGPLFYTFSAVGGVLAVVASQSVGMAIGRAAVVLVGTSLWYLQLQNHTLPDGAPSRLRWHPRRLLIALGVLEPADSDMVDTHREWTVRRLARAMRWANGPWPLSWLGRRSLIARTEQIDGGVLDEARRRYASAHLVLTTIDPKSEVMVAAIRAAHDDISPSRRVELEQASAEVLRIRGEVEQARAELEQRHAELAAERERITAEREQAAADIAALRAELAAERAELEQARVQAALARRAPTVVPPAPVLAPVAGGDADLIAQVAAFITEARAAGRAYGQRPVSAAFNVGRARAAELIRAAEQHLAGQSAATNGHKVLAGPPTTAQE